MNSKIGVTKSRKRAENNKEISGHMLTLHHRLYHALNLAPRSYNNRERKWQCPDIEIQRLILRSTDAFLDSITNETSQHPLVKDSVVDMVGALKGILHLRSEPVLCLASTVAVKMVNALPSPVIQPHVIEIVHPLSSLLNCANVQVSLSCAIALSLIISNISMKKESEVWEILRETKTVTNTVCNIKEFSGRTKLVEYFQEMILLLSKILWRWSSSRFCIWNDVELLNALDLVSLEPSFSAKISVLQLYSSIALCGNGAKKLLERKACLELMVQSMSNSDLHSVKMEGFKLAGCFSLSEQGCLKMLNECCESLVRATINAMSSCIEHSGKLSKDRISLLIKACHMATITQWAGEHHVYFWKYRTHRVMLDLLLNNYYKKYELEHHLSIAEQITIAQDGLNASHLLVLRPYIWDIVGGLASHGTDDLIPTAEGDKFLVNMLITCACLSFMESIRATRQICQRDSATTFVNEAASRAVLLMIYSPCKHIASQTKAVLCELLGPTGKEDVKYLLNTLNAMTSGDRFKVSDNLQMTIILISLASCSGLSEYQRHIIKSHGIKTLVSFLSSQLNRPFHIERSSVALHLRNLYEKKACCHITNGWEGQDMLLLFGLWALAELLHCLNLQANNAELSMGRTDYSESQLVSQLKVVCSGSYAPGPRWYAAYALSYFGHYGFPNKHGPAISKSLIDGEHTDLKLVLMNDESVSVHAVILMVRCRTLLPRRELSLDDKTSTYCLLDHDKERCERLPVEVRLSAHVDSQALSKLLDYIYSGFLQAGEDLVKKLRIFARHCHLHHLLQLLCRRSPRWGTLLPSFDLTAALGKDGRQISDVILEAKVEELVQWSCDICFLSRPHIHAHKVVVCSSCEYLQALFQSGMQESRSHTIKVPVSWKALMKLVHWFYSGELPLPMSGCLWDNLDSDEKLHEMVTYLELCWLAEFWLLQDLHEECSRVIISCLDSSRFLSIKILRLAASLNQWKLTEVSAEYVAPLYRRLRISGELEELDEELVDMVRAASVRLSQKDSTT
ncbi:hypothetical protein ACET3Z_009809 [Daucus carota]